MDKCPRCGYEEEKPIGELLRRTSAVTSEEREELKKVVRELAAEVAREKQWKPEAEEDMPEPKEPRKGVNFSF